MELVIVSGLSGAGKSGAADYLEDLGYFCVDNMPSAMLERFADFCRDAGSRFEKVALVTDIRSQTSFDELFSSLEALRSSGYSPKLLFMEAPTSVIVRRYKESRRPHPLQNEEFSIQQAVERERELLAGVRSRADWVLDTGDTTLGQLHNEILRIFSPDGTVRTLPVTVMSFGYKYGIPLEADLVMDVRFLPNPYYDPELRSLTGLDSAVRDYVLDNDTARSFLAQFTSLLSRLLPLYTAEGKASLTVAIGCTGGRHRSVAVTGAVTDALIRQGVNARSLNRDCGRGTER